jgi:adenosylcobinamide kinase / adenosylcobinamide-phosphate guanylyltransferase
MNHDVQLIFGGAWSGKTARAEVLAKSYDHVAWIGTASRSMPEMDEHIKALQSARPKHWQHFDSPLNLTDTLRNTQKSSASGLIVIDSVSQWLSNEIAQKAARHDDRQLIEILRHESDEFVEMLQGCARTHALLIVSADFGQSLAPQDSAQRTLRRCVGTTNIRIGALSKTVELIQAGFVIFKNMR